MFLEIERGNDKTFADTRSVRIHALHIDNRHQGGGANSTRQIARTERRTVTRPLPAQRFASHEIANF